MIALPQKVFSGRHGPFPRNGETLQANPTQVDFAYSAAAPITRAIGAGNGLRPIRH